MSRILIIFAPSAEKTVNIVLKWVFKRGVKFQRHKDLDYTKSKELISLSLNNHSFWNRKGNILITTQLATNDGKLVNYLASEWRVYLDNLIRNLEQNKHLGNYFLQSPNKLFHLADAQKAGLAIPATITTSSKAELNLFISKHKNIITKSLKDSFTGTYDGVYYYNHTEKISQKHVDGLEDFFFPSLFQEELEKAFELRIIFVNQELWTMAIFSQNDEKTSVDMRNYNYEKPNRRTPYILPKSVQENVLKFIEISGLNIGAIDMVVTKDKKHVFLECNPNGQISMVSECCNYPIEKHIANFLSTP